MNGSNLEGNPHAERGEAELLEKYRVFLGAKDVLNADLAAVNEEIGWIEDAIQAKLESSGRWSPGCKTAIPGLTVTVNQKWRARYDPEQWAEVLKWAVESGNQHVVQRRLSDKPILELLDAGTALPAGLSMESFNELGFRRS